MARNICRRITMNRIAVWLKGGQVVAGVWIKWGCKFSWFCTSCMKNMSGEATNILWGALMCDSCHACLPFVNGACLWSIWPSMTLFKYCFNYCQAKNQADSSISVGREEFIIIRWQLFELFVVTLVCVKIWWHCLIECRRNTARTPAEVLLVAYILEVIHDATFAHQTIQ